MSNRLFQEIIQQMQGTIDRTIGVIDHTATVIACSDLSRMGESGYISTELGEIGDIFERDHYTYETFGVSVPEYATFVEGTDAEAHTYASLITIALSGIKQYYDEKFDRTNFIKNVTLENILPGDIYAKSRELHFNNGVNRVVFLIRSLSPGEFSIYDIIQGLFPDKNRDFVFNIGENEIVLVKEIKSENIEDRDLENLALSIVDTLSEEYYISVSVGIGSPVHTVKELARSFKESQVAMEVSKVFDTEKAVANYQHLGIARLIYQLPITLCELYLREVFKRGSLDSLDPETLFTIQKFFDNNLNVSETSRKLFVHRNTLVYRLEKIRKLTGLDLREFDHAIIFKVALMVRKYLAAIDPEFS